MNTWIFVTPALPAPSGVVASARLCCLSRVPPAVCPSLLESTTTVCTSFLQSLSTYVHTPTPHSILRFKPAPQTPDLHTSNLPLCGKQVMLWHLYTLYSRTYMLLCSRTSYIVPGTWYRVPRTPGCNPSDAWCNWSTQYHQASRNQNGFGRGRRCLEGIIRGLHRCNKGRNQCSFRGVWGTNVNAHTNTPTHQYTNKGSKNT